MRASEWQFLCAVHEQPKSCCAIDYCCHTLDWAANVVTDQKIFASRLVALSDTHNKNMAMKNLVNVFRRLHRIFAHAWFQHRSVFWSVEGQTGLYVFFKRVCDMYDLIPGETYKLPPEAEGLESEAAPLPEPTAEQKAEAGGPAFSGVARSGAAERLQEEAAAEEDQGVGRTNTRRHIRSSPSTGSAVTTVIEADEDEGAELARKTRDLHISGPPEPLEEEPEAEDIPVMVEDSVIHEPSGTTESPTDAETPVQPSAEVPAEDAGGDQSKESSSGAEPEPAAAESQAGSQPSASKPEPAAAEEASGSEKPAEDSSTTKEEDENDATVKDPFPAEQQGEPAGDSPASEPVESTPEGKPSEIEATEEPEASSGATEPTADAKAEEPQKEGGNP